MDGDLIQQRFRADDATMLEEIERRHRSVVVPALERAFSLGSREASAVFDLALQDLWDNRRTYEPADVSIGVFLFRIASRLAVARLSGEERRGTRKPVSPSEAVPSAERDAILAAYDHLQPPYYRDILRLDLAAEGVASSRFLARVTGLPEVEVPAHRRRARKRLEKNVRMGTGEAGAGREPRGGDSILKLLLAALRGRGDLIPLDNPAALEQWLGEVAGRGQTEGACVERPTSAPAPAADASDRKDRTKGGKEVDAPLPPGWLDDLENRVDFECSFQDLEGRTHFHAEAFRGLIRSLQLRWDEAWKHFDRAQQLVDEADENIPNLIREFLLHIWCFENAIVEAPLIETNINPPALWIPDLPQQVMDDYPEVRLVLDMRRNAEAMLRLHLGHWHDARDIYEKLIQEYREPSSGSLGLYHAGLAACHYALVKEGEAEEQDEVFRDLDNAGVACLADGKTLRRATLFSILCAFHGFLGTGEEESWRRRIRSLPCPEATRKLFLERADLIEERCEDRGTLLVL
jgi:DNA-directed RNA polymerase specialized sigma24 family protein